MKTTQERTELVKMVMYAICDEEYMMMIYERGGVTRITFAMEEDEGILIPGPFPQYLLDDYICMRDLTELFEDEGYVLSMAPEQMISRN